jgi:fructose-bisphosphate aldolase class I
MIKEVRMQTLETIAKALAANAKGILAADETVGTLTKRFEKLKIPSTAESRRNYRELLFTTAGSADFISGIIMHDETIRQQASNGKQLVDIVLDEKILPGIKVDSGARPLAGSEGETVTEGLDGLRERLQEYRAIGARFAKWRAVFRVTDQLPTPNCIAVNAHALGRYAALCQEQGMVPIVEPEVLMDGPHTLERCSMVTGNVLNAVFRELYDQKVSLEAMLLKPNMMLSGSTCPIQAEESEVADATLRCLFRHVPVAVPGIVFLSGGQTDLMATVHLNAIRSIGITPWTISFSYGRALQDLALATWLGNEKNYRAAQGAFYHRARCNAAASIGNYTATMEYESGDEMARRHRSDNNDD